MYIIRNIMTDSIEKISRSTASSLTEIGLQIRQRRKSFKITANAAAEAAGISRVTLHRIEKGEPSVSMGAYLSVLSVLDLSLSVAVKEHADIETGIDRVGWLPARIPLADYPQLKELGWHIQGVDELSPLEAHSIYERNKRFLEEDKFSDSERALIESLRVAFEGVVP
jgi:transcriptional regulator with XRE-family HTH domain